MDAAGTQWTQWRRRVEPTIDCRDLFLKLGDDEVLVVDCREEVDWDRYPFQIPGALRMSLRELREAAQALPDDELIVLCGVADDGSDVKKAYRQLQLRGREAVRLEGGLRTWVEHGFPTERVGPPQEVFSHPRAPSTRSRDSTPGLSAATLL